MIRGISGGERKRLSIAVELVAYPSVLFLDEPTSGLDSKIAADVCQILKDVAQTGCTVVASIHQPSSEVFTAPDEAAVLLPLCSRRGSRWKAEPGDDPSAPARSSRSSTSS